MKMQYSSHTLLENIYYNWVEAIITWADYIYHKNHSMENIFPKLIIAELLKYILFIIIMRKVSGGNELFLIQTGFTNWAILINFFLQIK